MPPEDACPLGLAPESCAVLAGGTNARSGGDRAGSEGGGDSGPGHDSGGQLDSSGPGTGGEG
jgi:hypothetical protein